MVKYCKRQTKTEFRSITDVHPKAKDSIGRSIKSQMALQTGRHAGLILEDILAGSKSEKQLVVARSFHASFSFLNRHFLPAEAPYCTY